ncbi:hypothetical protein GGC47_005516 [Bosea sp. OAE752]|uniref:hypothetical protein n=1 Tax=Bosea sp. OAE752 TaxID=2663873 RepID=UPI003D25C6F0
MERREAGDLDALIYGTGVQTHDQKAARSERLQRAAEALQRRKESDDLLDAERRRLKSLRHNP